MAGKCFGCGELGHVSRNCPRNSVVKSQSKGPPGTSTFNMEFTPYEESDPENEIEVLDSLPLGAIFIEDDRQEAMDQVLLETEEEYQDIADRMRPRHPNWREFYPYWCMPGIQPRREIGDCYAMVASSILTTEQPYPGDEIFDPERIYPPLRFEVKRRRDSPDYYICDRLLELRVPISGTLLTRPQFDISRWYAKHRSKAHGFELGNNHHFPMGYAVNMVASKLLVDGISTSYPCTNPYLNPEDRFAIYPRQLNDDVYRINDKDLEITLPVARTLLEDPSFDLVAWYKQQLEGPQWGGIYRRRYRELHLQAYDTVPEITHEVEEMDLDYGEPAEDADQGEGTSNQHLPPQVDFSDEATEWESVRPPLMEEPSGSFDVNMDSLPEYLESEPDEAGAESLLPTGDGLAQRLAEVLLRCQPFPGDGPPVHPDHWEGDNRFRIDQPYLHPEVLEVYDKVQGLEARISKSLLGWDLFSAGKWYAERCAYNAELEDPWKVAHEWMRFQKWEDTTMGPTLDIVTPLGELLSDGLRLEECDLELGGIQVDRNKYPALQRNASQVRGSHRVLLKPVVVKVIVNDHPAKALLDSGSLGDFISTTLTDQLAVQKKALSVPLSLQLAVQGSRSKVNYAASVRLRYQSIDEERTLDVININSYDLILGMPWLYQHKVCLGFNPARIIIGHDEALPLRVSPDTRLLVHSLSMGDQQLEAAREELRKYAEPLCKEVHETDLPPFRAINHTIPLIDETKIYPWRPSRCPEVFRAQWAEKRDAYIKSGRWKITSAGNTVPMLLITKPGTNPPELRTVVDLRERNKNTRKMTSPLPDMEGMLRRTASKPFRTALDLKSAYEQIRIVPEHVDRTTVTTPDGNMVSQVVQIGDCNAPATHQGLMNFLFSAYIGRFLDIYLDDIVIYSDNLEEHLKHVKIVLDILQKEKLYLSRSKLKFMPPELKLLSRVIDNEGIRMDSAKVDSVLNWKVPTNRDLLRGFIGWECSAL